MFCKYEIINILTCEEDRMRNGDHRSELAEAEDPDVDALNLTGASEALKIQKRARVSEDFPALILPAIRTSSMLPM